MDFRGDDLAMTGQGLARTTAALGTGAAEIWTLLNVETLDCGFLSDRRPQLLFERHVFHQLTGGRFDDGDISDATPGGYGAGGAQQYDRLACAMTYDSDAALQSASWGLGQVLGRKFAAPGFANVTTMVEAMCESEDIQLGALTAFIEEQGLQDALATHDSSVYNGASYASNHDTKLQSAFTSYSVGPLPDLTARSAQLYLAYLALDPGPVDGVAGQLTRAAIMQFQQKERLPQTGEADTTLLDQLVARLPP